MQQQRPGSSASEMVPNLSDPDDTAEAAQRLRYIEHAGKRILLADISGCNSEQVAQCIDAVPQHVTKQPEHSVLLLADFTGTDFNREIIEHLKIAAVFDRAHVAKSAWVLAHNQHGLLIDSIRTFSAREIAVFPTRDEALDYLVS